MNDFKDFITPLTVDYDPKGISISNVPHTSTPIGVFVTAKVEARCAELYKYCVENGLSEIDYNDGAVK